jgi:ferredoxin
MAKSRVPRKAPALIRWVIALAVLGLFICAYLSPGIASNGILAPLVKGQFSAALYRTGIIGVTVIVLLVLTLLWGRVYCSVLCPLGTLQELFWRIGIFLRGKLRNTGNPSPGAAGLLRKGYVKPPMARYAAAILAGAGAVFAFSPLIMLCDPVSTFGRGMGAIRAFVSGNGAAFTLIIALPLALILALAFFRGRAFCDWCPVGLTLGLFSSAAAFGIKVSSGCASCGICEKKCPAGCIDSRKKQIDSGRCVLCFSCAASCPSGSAAYGFSYRGKAPRPFDQSRRVFLQGAGKASLLCGAAYLLGPGLKLFSRAPDKPAAALGANPILPPGAKSLGHYSARCIGCQACVASCPAGIIKVRNPSPEPSLDYAGAGCQFNCVECGRVCPTGAIRRLTVEEKHRTRVALSALYFERCVVNTKHESCGACAEVCPTSAITMTAYTESGVAWLTRPVFDEQYCIGCGACYAACPAEPLAFTIAAVPEQTLTVGARPAEEAGDELRIENTEDFPF